MWIMNCVQASGSSIVCCLETSESISPVTQFQTPKQQNHQLKHCLNLKTHIIDSFCLGAHVKLWKTTQTRHVNSSVNMEQHTHIHMYVCTYIYINTYINLLTPWCRVLLEKLIGLQLVKKFPAFDGTRKFITALTTVRHLSLSWASPIHSIYPHPTSWRSIIILSTHLRLGIHKYICVYMKCILTSSYALCPHGQLYHLLLPLVINTLFVKVQFMNLDLFTPHICYGF